MNIISILDIPLNWGVPMWTIFTIAVVPIWAIVQMYFRIKSLEEVNKGFKEDLKRVEDKFTQELTKLEESITASTSQGNENSKLLYEIKGMMKGVLVSSNSNNNNKTSLE